MGLQVTVTLPEKTYRRAKHLAQLTSRDVAHVLADTLELSLPAFDMPPHQSQSITEMPDAVVLALTNLELSPADDNQLSLLLGKQQAGNLTEPERLELSQLMQLYQEGLLQKAQVLAEVVRRGLRPPLTI